MTEEREEERLILKWGTLTGWRFRQPKMIELLERYIALGMTWSAMQQRDAPEQKQLICEMIDAGDFDTVYLDWDGKHVSKEQAKEYVMNYGKEADAAPTPAPVATPTEEKDDA